MSDLRALDLVEVISAAQSALSAALGKPARIRDTQVLSEEDRRNLIVRACAEFSDGRTQSVIVKATRSPDYDPGAGNAFDTSGLIKEWVATALLTSRNSTFRHGSRLWRVRSAMAFLCSRTLALISVRSLIRSSKAALMMRSARSSPMPWRLLACTRILPVAWLPTMRFSNPSSEQGACAVHSDGGSKDKQNLRRSTSG